MERRKTLTMSWDGLGDVDDDDAFFESYNRLSTAVPHDLASSSEDEDEDFDDPRLSFASAISSAQSRKPRATPQTDPAPDYGIWMAAPASISERRKRLLHGMGLDDNKEFLKATSIKLNHAISRKFEQEQDNPVSLNSTKTSKLPPTTVTVTTCNSSSITEEKRTEPTERTSVPLGLVRSRSESDMDSFSVEKFRKEELIGKASKQRLMRTATDIAFPRKVANNADGNRVGVRDSDETGRSKRKLEESGVRAFFLIKNLDTGKEFIVNEYGENGTWNRLSDLQTGKQLTMEEFEKTVGQSRVVNELMRRANVGRNEGYSRKLSSSSYISRSLRMSKRRGAALLKNIKGVASGFIGEREREAVHVQAQVTEAKNQWVKVRQSGKSHKELSALHLCQELLAHEGCIWTIRFSLDGRFLASGGEDNVIHVWEVQECEVMSLRPDEGNLTPLHPSLLSSVDRNAQTEPSSSPSWSQKKKKGKFGSKRGSLIPEYVHVPDTVFSLSEKPHCSFRGHSDDVLDLSWSKSQLLLSSSMDKTVRLWDLETKTCLKMFAHNDYVTCIQFNPIDNDYFISGSLDAKVRIWNIPERHVVDWTDIHEMVTAVCYTPDGQSAFVGTHKGSCRTYSTEDCTLSQTGTIELRRKKKSQLRKVTGFQFNPSKPSEVLVTSADSRIRILDGSEVIHKFRGFKNANSQIAASFSPNGRYIISASEDSQVYVWKHEEHGSASIGKGRNIIVTRSHEHFQCKDVSIAIAWPWTKRGDPLPMPMNKSKRHSKHSQASSSFREDTTFGTNSKRMFPPLPKKSNNHTTENNTSSPKEDLAAISRTESGLGYSFSNSKRMMPPPPVKTNCHSTEEEDHDAISRTDSGIGDSFSSSSSSSVRCGDSPSISDAATSSWSSSYSLSEINHGSSTIHPSAWGLVIVTAGYGGEIKCYQNFGLPRRLGRQPHLFGGYNSFSHGNT
ncbi:WD repeat-containing protein 44-like [Abrus precatorius]|uniref:WD repeat-containing protein 44-like n=1 Tax=Abrus precatorius TaxID=3816 RepID=A0A8B8K0Y4_ABRPR|nr:WD repeat-containing protein 44-like [Abrus precatorius]